MSSWRRLPYYDKKVTIPHLLATGFDAAGRGTPYIPSKNIEHHQSFSLGYIEGQPAPERIHVRGELKAFWLGVMRWQVI
jgi:hypothetical protein